MIDRYLDKIFRYLSVITVGGEARPGEAAHLLCAPSQSPGRGCQESRDHTSFLVLVSTSQERKSTRNFLIE